MPLNFTRTNPSVNANYGRAMEIILVCAAVALATSVIYSWGDAYVQRVTVLFLIYLSAVISLSVFSGTSGVMTFGHVGFMGLGAYVGASLTLAPKLKAKFLPGLPDFVLALDLPIEFALPIACIVVGIVALVIGFPVCRMPSASAPIATLGLLIIIHGLLIGAKDYTRGAQPIFGLSPLTGYSTALIFSMLAIATGLYFRKSTPGLQLQASRDDELAARAVGVRVTNTRLIAWVISAMIIAGAGVLIAHYLTAFSPKKFYLVDMFALLAMGIVGGLSTITGAIVGTLLITVITELARQVEGHTLLAELGLPPLFGLTQILMALAILTVMYRRPAGLISYRELTENCDRYLKRLWFQVPATEDLEVITEPGVNLDADSLVVQGVGKSFAGLRALNDVSMIVDAGEIVGLIGPNGSGKTTLVNAISGAVSADEGEIKLGAQNLQAEVAASIARAGIARTFQNIRLFSNMSVRDNVFVAASTRAAAADVDRIVQSALIDLDLLEHAERTAGTLPYGLQRRTEIARALAMRPSFLLLDEPTAGMNANETNDILQRLDGLREKYRIGILVIEHDQNFVMRLCDRIYVLNKGEIIASGRPEEVQQDPVVLNAYLGRRSNVLDGKPTKGEER